MSGTLVIIPCGQGKIWDKLPGRGATSAIDAYTGTPFRVNAEYAQKYGDRTMILSALHGFIPTEFPIPGPYNVTFKRKSTNPVAIEALRRQISELRLHESDRIVALGGKEYRSAIAEAFREFGKEVEFPFAGLTIGKAMQAIKQAIREDGNSDQTKELSHRAVTTRGDRRKHLNLEFGDNIELGESHSVLCATLHRIFNELRCFSVPYDVKEIPQNGIYVLFEEGESAHGGQRIVRIGTHTGPNQLRSRMKQHFLNENKDRSIFRKNIGRCFLNQDQDTFLTDWELDLTTRAAKEKHAQRINADKQREVERRVTSYMQAAFRFVVFPVLEEAERLRLESLIISTVSRCPECGPSTSWLGLASPVSKIRESGLWQVNELFGRPFNTETLAEFQQSYFRTP